MKIEFLSFPDCPGIAPALNALASAMLNAGVHDPIEHIDIRDAVDAEAHAFLGSPSIHINGLDIEADRRGDPPCLGCRIYPGGKPFPPDSLVEQAIREALNKEVKPS